MTLTRLGTTALMVHVMLTVTVTTNRILLLKLIVCHKGYVCILQDSMANNVSKD